MWFVPVIMELPKTLNSSFDSSNHTAITQAMEMHFTYRDMKGFGMWLIQDKLGQDCGCSGNVDWKGGLQY